MTVLEALRGEVARTWDFLDALAPGDWERPTRCPPMTVLEIAVHAWRGGVRIGEMLAAGPVDAPPEKSGATYFTYDVARVSPDVVRRAAESAADKSGETFAAQWRGGWEAALAAAGAALEDDAVYRGVFGLIRISEYLRTRIVEVTVHAMDLRDALGLEPDPTPAALEATGDVLRELAGADLRPLGLDDLRFALIGTGRGSPADAERGILGELADRLPLLA